MRYVEGNRRRVGDRRGREKRVRYRGKEVGEEAWKGREKVWER